MIEEKTDIWNSIRVLRKKLGKNKCGTLKEKSSLVFDEIERNSLSFTCELENKDQIYDVLKNAISPQFSKPIEFIKQNENLPLQEIQNIQCFSRKKHNRRLSISFSEKKNNEEINILKNENQELLMENEKLNESLKNVQQLLNKVRKENSKQITRMQNEFKKELNEQKNNFSILIEKMKQDYESNLQSKEEEISIMNSLMSNTCETEPNQRFQNPMTEEKYDNILESLKEEFQYEITKLNQEFKSKIQFLTFEKNDNLKEISNLKKEIQRLRSKIGKDSDCNTCNTQRVETTRSTFNSETMLSQENKEKILQNLLYKINKYVDNDSIDNEITPNNKKDVYEMVSARGERKNKYHSEKTPYEKFDKNSENVSEDEIYLNEEEDNIFWMNNSIKNLKAKFNKF